MVAFPMPCYWERISYGLGVFEWPDVTCFKSNTTWISLITAGMWCLEARTKKPTQMKSGSIQQLNNHSSFNMPFHLAFSFNGQWNAQRNVWNIQYIIEQQLLQNSPWNDHMQHWDLGDWKGWIFPCSNDVPGDTFTSPAWTRCSFSRWCLFASWNRSLSWDRTGFHLGRPEWTYACWIWIHIM